MPQKLMNDGLPVHSEIRSGSEFEAEPQGLIFCWSIFGLVWFGIMFLMGGSGARSDSRTTTPHKVLSAKKRKKGTLALSYQ